jgi:hypothetical protein
VAAACVRPDLRRVTSFVRALGLRQRALAGLLPQHRGEAALAQDIVDSGRPGPEFEVGSSPFEEEETTRCGGPEGRNLFVPALRTGLVRLDRVLSCTPPFASWRLERSGRETRSCCSGTGSKVRKPRPQRVHPGALVTAFSAPRGWYILIRPWAAHFDRPLTGLAQSQSVWPDLDRPASVGLVPSPAPNSFPLARACARPAPPLPPFGRVQNVRMNGLTPNSGRRGGSRTTP